MVTKARLPTNCACFTDPKGGFLAPSRSSRALKPTANHDSSPAMYLKSLEILGFKLKEAGFAPQKIETKRKLW